MIEGSLLCMIVSVPVIIVSVPVIIVGIAFSKLKKRNGIIVVDCWLSFMSLLVVSFLCPASTTVFTVSGLV